MKNPFSYGGVVGSEAFCNREKEMADIRRAIDNNVKLFIISERRFGKTSLVHQVLNQLPRDRYISAYADLWPTDSGASFAATMAKAISEAMATTTGRLLATAKDFFGGLNPSVTMDDEGKPSINFDISRVNNSINLEDVLAVPAKVAARGKKNVVIVLDEFQQILEYDDDKIEPLLRSIIQNQPDVSYLFLGSRKHVIRTMLLDQNCPLYRAGGHYPLHAIDVAHWTPFVEQRFAGAQKHITAEQIGSVCHLTDGHPFYTQHLFHIIWELCEPQTNVTEELIKSAVELLLDRENYAYTSLWESFTVNQRRFLKGISLESSDVKPFSGEFIQRYGLRSPSNVQRVADKLLESDVIDRDKGRFVISDRFLKIWLHRHA